MPTVQAVPGVSPSSAQRVSQDIVGGRAWNKANGLGDRNSVTGSGGSGGRSSSSSWQSLLNQYQAMIQANVQANNEFNAQQAQLNRDWQEKMSNTAHQREVADLKAAGLNPVLSAMNGNGAATTSGATAIADTSGNSALVGLLGSLVQGYVSMENQRASAQANLAIADKYTAMSKYMAELQAKTQLTTTNIQTAASKWMAELSAKTSLSVAQTQQATQKIVANIQAAAQRYGYQLSSWTQMQVAQINGQINKELKQMGIEADFKMQDTSLSWKGSHPSNTEQALLWSGLEYLDGLEQANSARREAFEEWSSNRQYGRGTGFNK